MEIRGRFVREGAKWAYQCELFRGEGNTPDEAYLDYLKKFEYRGPELPTRKERGQRDGATD